MIAAHFRSVHSDHQIISERFGIDDGDPTSRGSRGEDLEYGSDADVVAVGRHAVGDGAVAFDGFLERLDINELFDLSIAKNWHNLLHPCLIVAVDGAPVCWGRSLAPGMFSLLDPTRPRVWIEYPVVVGLAQSDRCLEIGLDPITALDNPWMQLPTSTNDRVFHFVYHPNGLADLVSNRLIRTEYSSHLNRVQRLTRKPDSNIHQTTVVVQHLL